MGKIMLENKLSWVQKPEIPEPTKLYILPAGVALEIANQTMSVSRLIWAVVLLSEFW